ncbi:MAG: hypothetical protein EBW94_00410 [Proteobacteria bacterium]|nr:hypothetical protein [Pseudomonadota bacterium]
MQILAIGWNKSPRSKGFSLIELLVIFLIIGIISSIVIVSMDLRSFSIGRSQQDIHQYFFNLKKESILLDKPIRLFFVDGNIGHCIQEIECEYKLEESTLFKPTSRIVSIKNAEGFNYSLEDRSIFASIYPNGRSSYAKIIFEDDFTYETQ